MARREDTLIPQIESDALDDKVPLATALRKAVVLGGKSGSEELRDWATRELQGYHGEDNLPDYRVINAPLRIDGIAGNYKVTRQSFPPSAIPDFAQKHVSERLELREGVGGLEALLAQSEIKLMPAGAADLVRLMNAENMQRFQHIESLYWDVSHAAIRGVLDHIRTALTRLVAELRANMSEDEDVPTAAAASNAVNVVMTGKRARLNLTAAQTTAQASPATADSHSEVAPTETGYWTRSRKIGAFVVGLATVVAAVIAVIEFV